MKKLREILWIALVFTYLIVLKDGLRKNIIANWIIWIGIIMVIFIILVGMSFIKGKVADSFKQNFPKIMYDYGKINGFVYSITIMICLCFLIPMLLIYFLENSKFLMLGKELNIYTSLILSSMLVTFYGKKIVELLNRFVIDNPSQKSVNLSEKVVSEDIIKTFLFGIYFIFLIVSAIVKYNHTSVLIFDEVSVNVIILAFTTYIALDRTVTSYRKARS